MDSHHELGFDAPPQDIFSLRFISHCAPLTTVGFNNTFTFIDQEHDNRTMQLFQLLYGSWVNYYKGARPKDSTNYTFQVPLNSPMVDVKTGVSVTSPTGGYALGYVS